ncbi:ABC transporter substrate-binding protein [Pontibacter ruber]|uniref:ABC transporter substrate-binding protein n=1 Tax=Pontibacter ruber TaxID=1343895 RepID=A0ABW5D1A9_9BACT|nr:ABC transporter substrate-binding protein [Pontibacter ruber]
MKRSFIKHVAGVLVMAALAMPAQAQLQDYGVNYKNGKTLIDQQQYDKAMAELLPVTNAASNNTYAPEASYLYALAALKANKLPQAHKMLLQLKEQHKDWQSMAEANYLLANVLFEEKEYERALSELDQLSSSKLSADAEGLKRYYLNRLNDRAAYEKLLQRYPDDKIVAQVYADKLLSGWYKPQDKAKLESIVSKHKLDRDRYLRAGSANKQGYNVAVLLPFQLNQNLAQTARKNQFVTDLYAGMQLAQDSLRKQGITINLFAYDTGSDTTGVRKVLSTPELKQMDLVVGPVYKSAAKMAAQFAEQNNINVINPLSQDLELTRNNENVFLFESSVATQARQAATYAYNTFTPKTAVILFENSKDDTTFASHYRQQFIKLGGKVKTYKKINSSQSTATATTFNNLKLDEVGHLAVFSDKMTAAVNATSVLSALPVRMPLMTYESWLDINQISLKQLDEQEVYFISPKYMNKMSSQANGFRRSYVSRYNLPPSSYAYAGFEMLYYFGSMLKAYGPHFNGSLAEAGIRPGVFYQAVGYTDAAARKEVRHDNQFVPITKLENLQLMVVNPVYN